MDLRLIEHFSAVVEYKSVLQAANALYIAQPALSRSIKILERELGAELFIRKPSGMELTEAGRNFELSAREMLHLASQTDSVVKAAAELRSGRVDIAAPSDLSVKPLAHLVSIFRQQYPNINVLIRSIDSSASAASLLNKAECELAVDYADDPSVKASWLQLGRQELMIGYPESSDSDLNSVDPMQLLEEHPLIAPRRGSAIRSRLDAAASERDVELKIATEVEHLHIAGSMLAAGVGLAIVDADTASRLEYFGVRSRSFNPSLSLEYGLIRRPNQLTPAAEAFISLARASIAGEGQ